MSKVKNELIDIIEKYNVQVINIINNSNSPINKRIEQIFVINLIHEVEKRNYIITLLKKYGINFTLVIVDFISNDIYNELSNKMQISKSELGCCVSHLWCLNQIIKNKLKNAIIFEDDIILHKDFVNRFIKIYDKKPDLDFLLLGSHDHSFSLINYKNVKHNLYKPNNESQKLYGAHANYYSLTGAKRKFLIRTSEISFFDKEYMLMFNYFPKSYICCPNLVVSNITTSTLNHSRTILSDLESEYYRKCFINFNFEKYNFLYVNLLTKINLSDFNEKDTYKSFTEKYLYNYFYNFDKINTIKNRLVTDFFTIEDIKNITKKYYY